MDKIKFVLYAKAVGVAAAVPALVMIAGAGRKF